MRKLDAYVDGTKDRGVLSGRLACTVIEQVAFRDNNADLRANGLDEQMQSAKALKAITLSSANSTIDEIHLLSILLQQRAQLWPIPSIRQRKAAHHPPDLGPQQRRPLHILHSNIFAQRANHLAVPTLPFHLLQDPIDILSVRRQRILLLLHASLNLLMALVQAALSLVDLVRSLLRNSAQLIDGGFEILALGFEIPEAGFSKTIFVLRGVEPGLNVVLFGL